MQRIKPCRFHNFLLITVSLTVSVTFLQACTQNNIYSDAQGGNVGDISATGTGSNVGLWCVNILADRSLLYGVDLSLQPDNYQAFPGE